MGDRVLDLDAPYAADKADLLSTIATHLRCRAVARTRHTVAGKERSMHLFGHASDLERTELLYTSLLLQSATGLARTPVPRGEHAAAFRRSWLAGFRMAIGRRLAACRGPRRDRGRDAVRRRRPHRQPGARRPLGAGRARPCTPPIPDLRTARPRSLSGSGIADGWAAGQRADLGGRPVGRTTKARHLLR